MIRRSPAPSLPFGLGHHVVAKGLAARQLALERAAELTAPSLLAQVGEVKLRHRAQHADVHRADFANIHGDELDACEGTAVMKVCDISEFAAEAIERLNNDHVEDAGVEFGQKLLISRPEAARATHRGVSVGADPRPTLLLDVAGADLDLVLNRGLALVLAAEAGVNDRAHDRLPKPPKRDQSSRFQDSGAAALPRHDSRRLTLRPAAVFLMLCTISW